MGSLADAGVCLLMRLGPHRILLDCGLVELSPLLEIAEKTPPPVDLVLCSHAHPDHAQGLLALHQTWPEIPIYASEVTTQLLPLNWVPGSLTDRESLAQALPWRSPIELSQGLIVQLWPAGHLPGAAAFLLTYTPNSDDPEAADRTYTVFYTGDFFLSHSRLVEGFPLEELRSLRPDILITEGSYGTARYPRRRQQENQLVDQVSQAIAGGYGVLLPTPVLGLGQEILMLLRSHHQFTGQELDIWVDGAVAWGCDAYLALLPHLPATVQNFARHQPLFWDDRIRPRVRRLEPDQRRLVGQNPCIVVMTQNQDLSQYCEGKDTHWVVMLPQRLNPGPVTELEQIQCHCPQIDPVGVQTALDQGRLKVLPYFLSEHCDGPGTTQLIHNLRPQHVIFVHGSPTDLAALTALEELRNRYQLHTPATNTLVELPIGETFIQPPAPANRYGGELREEESAITLTLTPGISADPHWGQFADTGFLEARWQGEELVLRAIPQRELLHQGGDRPGWLNTECCGNCQHYGRQLCWNQDSPLFGFKVTPDGYCPSFSPLPFDPA